MLPMPQMFPMPFVLLMSVTSALLLLSMVRIYWQGISTSRSEASEAKAADFHFEQAW